MAKKKVAKIPTLSKADQNALRRIMKKVRAIGAAKRAEAKNQKNA